MTYNYLISKSNRLATTLLFGMSAFTSLGFAGDSPPLNVLMIAVDDLRPMLGCYGDPDILTPNIDRLASRGTTFFQAHVQSPQCGPSRVSLMTGLRPDSTGIYTLNSPRFNRSRFPDIVTLSQQFMNHGYHSQGYGKIFHDGRDDVASWSVPSSPGRKGEISEYVDEAAIANVPFAQRSKVPTIIPRYSPDIERRKNCPPFQAADVPDETLFAGRMTNQVIDDFQKLKNKPFFLAVGYRKPHLPWVAPKKYFDQYPLKEISVAGFKRIPKNAPIAATFHDTRSVRGAWKNTKTTGINPVRMPDDQAMSQRFFTSTELRSYRSVDYADYPAEHEEREYRRAYMACVSYVDAQIGRLLEGLEEAGLAESTIVVLWGDHGFHLGESGMFGKLTNYEWSTRVPLIVSVPQSHPNVSNALVELVDVYPTLCDLVGLPIPSNLEGTSMRPLLDQPNRPWKRAVFSQYPREEGGLMGRSVRTEHFRFVEWTDIKTSAVYARELYDHRIDPFETVSLHEDTARSADVKRLADILYAGWKSSRP